MSTAEAWFRNRDTIFRKALRALPALKHRTELGVCHAQHIHGEEIAVYPGVQNVWTHYVRRGTIMILSISSRKFGIFAVKKRSGMVIRSG